MKRTNSSEQARVAALLAAGPRGSFKPVALPEWGSPPRGLVKAWTNNHESVQLIEDPACGVCRLSIRRHDEGSLWWEDLQRIKAEVGFADATMVEIYPAKEDVVDVANMRHLWFVPDDFAIGWKAT